MESFPHQCLYSTKRWERPNALVAIAFFGQKVVLTNGPNEISFPGFNFNLTGRTEDTKFPGFVQAETHPRGSVEQISDVERREDQGEDADAHGRTA